MFFLIFTLLANLWIYRIFGTNFILGIVLIACTHFLYRYNKNSKQKRTLLFMFLITLLLQVTTTQRMSLTEISNDDRRIIDQRLKAYPSNLLRVGYWLEERKESIIFNRITTNFFENIDPNFYFFAGHPRQRAEVDEFEKFPYILCPVFFIGIVQLLKKKNYFCCLTFFFVPLLMLSLIGNHNRFGPFSLFPFFAVTIASGIENLFLLINKRRKIIYSLIILFILIFIQIISYEIY